MKKLEMIRNIFNQDTILTRTELKNVFGGDIRKYRDEKCYTQSYMASQLGIGQSAYQKIESGDIKISMERLIQIANILGKPIDIFFTENRNQSEIVKTAPNIQVSESEFTLMQKIILEQEKRIEELEAKVARKDQKIEELKNQLQ